MLFLVFNPFMPNDNLTVDVEPFIPNLLETVPVCVRVLILTQIPY